MSGTDEAGEQLALLAGVRPARPRLRGEDPPADERPVALVQVDTGLAHLDRPFEYVVPASTWNVSCPAKLRQPRDRRSENVLPVKTARLLQ